MFNATEIANLIHAREGAVIHPEAIISSLSIDSRQITDHTNGVCFVALKGLRSDGHQFLEQVWQQGVRNFIVESAVDIPDLQDSNIFKVENTVHALQEIALAYRTKFTLLCIGITGSNGKTWVKEWLYQLLAPEYFIVKSPRSYNSQIGVPLSVLQIRKEHTLGIFEAGISKHGEMARLSAIIRPDIGVLTHLGDAHQAGFASMEEKLVEKLQLFRNAKTIVYGSNEKWIDEVVRRELKGKELLSWKREEVEQTEEIEEIEKVGKMGKIGEVEEVGVLHVTSIVKNEQGKNEKSNGLNNEEVQIHYRWKGQQYSYWLPFSDPASIENSITCCLVLLQLGYTSQEIAKRMEGLHPIALRLAIHHLPGNSVLINDSYSLDLGSLSVALETLKQHSAGMPRTVILSDIDHQHAGSYAAIADLLRQKEVHHVLGIGSEIPQLRQSLSGTMTFDSFPDMAGFLSHKPWKAYMPGAFLLKGARSFHFERLAEHMQGRYHSAVLEIDLNTLLINLQYFISRLHQGTKIIAMVKAAAYGSGGAEIARFLAFHNVAILAVAYIDEGIDLRTGGIDVPIIVMNPDPSRLDQLYEYRLEPEVFDFSLLQALQSEERDTSLDIHIKVDTGMHRLGFKRNDAPELIRTLSAQKRIRVASVFTHLAAAGNQNERDFTRDQVKAFDSFYEELTKGLGYRPMRHVLNTNGVLYFPEYQYEAVRLGIGLYGAGLPETIPHLQAVHTLKARISQIHEIETGTTVGYDRAFKAPRDMRLGTINIGYADGLRRCAGHLKYPVLVHGKRAAILGKVCMDMAMIDLTNHPEAQPGDEVIVFGPDHPVDELARVCDTIPYEILTGISQRVARVFLYS